MYVLSIYELIKIIQYYIAIKRTPHFGVWSASPCGLKLGGLHPTPTSISIVEETTNPKN